MQAKKGPQNLVKSASSTQRCRQRGPADRQGGPADADDDRPADAGDEMPKGAGNERPAEGGNERPTEGGKKSYRGLRDTRTT